MSDLLPPLIKKPGLTGALTIDGDAACINEPLHLHVWERVRGVQIMTHGDILFSVGIVKSEFKSVDELIQPGFRFEYRLRNQLKKAERYVDSLYTRHNSIRAVLDKVAEDYEQRR